MKGTRKMRKANPKIIYRKRTLKAMDAFIDAIGDEEILETWLTYGIPDCANDSDFDYIASYDEEYADVLALFKSIVKDVEA